LPANGAYLQPELWPSEEDSNGDGLMTGPALGKVSGLGVVAFWFDAGGAGEGGVNPGIVIPKF